VEIPIRRALDIERENRMRRWRRPRLVQHHCVIRFLGSDRKRNRRIDGGLSTSRALALGGLHACIGLAHRLSLALRARYTISFTIRAPSSIVLASHHPIHSFGSISHPP